MHEKDFPTLRIGSRMVVPKEKKADWLSQQLTLDELLGDAETDMEFQEA